MSTKFPLDSKRVSENVDRFLTMIDGMDPIEKWNQFKLGREVFVDAFFNEQITQLDFYLSLNKLDKAFVQFKDSLKLLHGKQN